MPNYPCSGSTIGGVIMANNDVWRYCYWIDATVLSTLQKQMLKKDIRMTEAKQTPCEAMIGEIGYAESHIWSVICKYDASPWYNKSHFKDKTLMTSSFSLGSEYEQHLETTITPVSFDQPYIPNKEQKKALIKDSVFQERKPSEWDNFPKEMGVQITQGLAKIAGKTVDSWENLFQTWTAVHANFVSPQYRTDGTYMNAPYSIGDSHTISSCCVELFNILESDEKSLLVRPCTGATMLKVLEKDRYYFVQLVKNN
jgi:hypothetical protein